MVSDILATSPPRDIELECYQGTVGSGAGAEFAAFVQVWRELPNPDSVLMNPGTADVPSEPSVLYALSAALARKATDQTAGALVEYANRLPREFSVLLIRDSARRSADFQSTRAYIKWCADNSDVLL